MLKIEEKLLHESTFLLDQSHQLKILLAASSRSFSKLFMFVYRAFQDHTERMRKKLANQMQQQVDDEDDRIAKTVAERERKREV